MMFGVCAFQSFWEINTQTINHCWKINSCLKNWHNYGEYLIGLRCKKRLVCDSETITWENNSGHDEGNSDCRQ